MFQTLPQYLLPSNARLARSLPLRSPMTSTGAACEQYGTRDDAPVSTVLPFKPRE